MPPMQSIAPLLRVIGRRSFACAGGIQVLDSPERGREAALDCTNDCSSSEGARMDDRVASAIAHWAPRFTTNGVTVSDFQRVTGQVERWEDWCAAWWASGPGKRRWAARGSAGGRWASPGENWRQPRASFTFPKLA